MQREEQNQVQCEYLLSMKKESQPFTDFNTLMNCSDAVEFGVNHWLPLPWLQGLAFSAEKEECNSDFTRLGQSEFLFIIGYLYNVQLIASSGMLPTFFKGW